MSVLAPEQLNRAIEVMRMYLNAPKGPDGKTPVEASAERDQNRKLVIESELRPLLGEFVDGKVPLDVFKAKVDSINKRNEHWGFKGIKGQMFFNMLVNVADDAGECDEELKLALALPLSEEIASTRIKAVVRYVKQIGHDHVEAGGTAHGKPKVGSVPYFLSYFWQIHDPDRWPVYYTNSVRTMIDLNLWRPTGEIPADYLAFKHIEEELAGEFSKASGRRFRLYDVEHVFWFKGGNPFGGSKPLPKEKASAALSEEVDVSEDLGTLSGLPESYVPPIVAVLPLMARRDPRLIEAAKVSGTSLDRAFEKSIDVAFSLLGFETQLLGQGQGRVPDGRALAPEDGYAILWDAKGRKDPYSMGTDDRTIKEYIINQSRNLKRQASYRNIYYLIVSSEFEDDYDESIASLKMETGINEVILLEAEALVVMVDAKLRASRQLTLGPDGIHRLFTKSRVLSASDVQATLD